MFIFSQESGLLPELESFKSSRDRVSRHGELTHLRDMKRKYHQAPQRRKVLKLESFHFEEEGVESDDDRIDIHDVDFRISNDKYQVHVRYLIINFMFILLINIYIFL